MHWVIFFALAVAIYAVLISKREEKDKKKNIH